MEYEERSKGGGGGKEKQRWRKPGREGDKT